MNKIILRNVVIEYLKKSKEKLSIVELLNILLIDNHISDKEKVILEMKQLREICSDLAEEGLLIEKPLGKFAYNNETKGEIIKISNHQFKKFNFCRAMIIEHGIYFKSFVPENWEKNQGC